MWRVVIGATRLTQLGPEAQVRNIKRLLAHEHYTSISERNDIALLELDQPVQCSSYIQLACVPDASLRVSEMTACYISGWGSTTARCEFPTSTRVLRAGLARWGDWAWASGQQRRKPESGCGDVRLERGGPDPLPKARPKGPSGTMPLRMQSQALGKGFTPRGGENWQPAAGS